MTRLSLLPTSLFLGALMLGISGCNASEPATQNVSTAPAAGQPANPRVLIETSKGNITVELFANNAPVSVQNFLSYANSGFYDGVIFHRVIPGFMIQGGGMLPGLKEKPTRAPIPNEADNGLKNMSGTIAMARTSDPHSASAQFFINTVDNAFLDHRGKTMQGWGYTVFGKVTQGMDVVKKIETVATSNAGMHQNVPVKDVVLQMVERVKPVHRKTGT